MGKVRFFMILIGMCMMNINSAHSSVTSCMRLYMNGQEWCFLENPIRKDTALFHSFDKYLPKTRIHYMDILDNYSGKWEVVDNGLYLRTIEVCIPGGEKNSIDVEIPEAELRKFFTAYTTEKGILATWLNGKIFIGKGKLLPYPPFVYEPIFKEECELTIENGIIVKTEYYHNSHQDGTNVYKEWRTIENRIPWGKFPKLKNKEIEFSVYNIRLTPDRYFDSGEIIITVDGKYMEDSHPFMKNFIKLLRETPNWEMFYVRGIHKGPVIGEGIKYSLAPPPKTDS